MIYGWHPDPAHAPRMGGAALRFGAAPSSASIAFGEVFDQGPTGSCVAQASAKCIEVVSGTRPSRLAIYEAARVLGGQSVEALRDEGCVPMHAVQQMASEGVAYESKWPFLPERVNEATPWDVIASDVGVNAWAKLDTAEQVRTAVAAGHPVMFGMLVDQFYEDYAGGLYAARVGPSLGGHMQTIVGYSSDGFRVLNSWGTGWGVGGCSWISEAWLFGGEPSDFYVLGAA